MNEAGNGLRESGRGPGPRSCRRAGRREGGAQARPVAATGRQEAATKPAGFCLYQRLLRPLQSTWALLCRHVSRAPCAFVPVSTEMGETPWPSVRLNGKYTHMEWARVGLQTTHRGRVLSGTPKGMRPLGTGRWFKKGLSSTEMTPFEGYSSGVWRAGRDLDTWEKLGFRENWHFCSICLRLIQALSLKPFKGFFPKLPPSRNGQSCLQAYCFNTIPWVLIKMQSPGPHPSCTKSVFGGGI